MAGRSAYGAAMVRATERFVPVDHRLFEDDIVIDFLPWPARFMIRREWSRSRFSSLFERGAPGIRGALLCRTRYIDDAVKGSIARGIRTVVILGAGLDTRPYRLRELAAANVYEVDLPVVQAFKKARLQRRFGDLPRNPRFIPVDFNSDSLHAALFKGGLNPREPAVFIWEGVSQYLKPEAATAVFDTLAGRPSGSELVFTYVLDEAVTGRFRTDRSQEFRKSAGRRPEPWHFGIDPAGLAEFLSRRGLTLLDDAGAEDHIRRYLQPRQRELAVSGIERVALARV